MKYCCCFYCFIVVNVFVNVVTVVVHIVVIDLVNLPLKFGQNWVSARRNIIVVVVVYVVVLMWLIPETYL